MNSPEVSQSDAPPQDFHQHSRVSGGSPLVAVVVDAIHTSSPEYHGIFSWHQWEGIRSKLHRAGINSEQTLFITLANLLSNPGALFGVEVIIGLGESPLRYFTEKKGIEKWNLSPLKTREGVWFVPTFDLLRLNVQYELHLYQEVAFLRAKELLTDPSPYRTEERFLLNPSVEETLAHLDFIAQQPEVSVDVETGYGQINTVGFAWSPHDAIAINVLPDRCGDDSFFEIFRGIAKVLKGPSRKIFQNFVYDVSYFSAYGIRTENIAHDTMWAMKFLWPEFDMNLGNVGRFYTKRTYWKDDGKNEESEGKKKDWGNVRDWNKHYTYNCLSKDMQVLTDQGPLPIGTIARKRMKLNVLSLNEKTRAAEWKPVTNWLVQRESQNIEWTKIVTAGMGNHHGLLVTPDHKVLTVGGWKEAAHVHPGDIMIRMGVAHDAGTVLGTALGDCSFGKSASKTVKTLTTSQINEELVELKSRLFGGVTSRKFRRTEYGSNWFFDLYVPACEQFNNLSKMTTSEILPLLTPMGLALWFMDDGCMQKAKYSPHMKLALQSYPAYERKMILGYFKDRYGETASLDSAGNLNLSTRMSQKLCKELGCYFVPSLRYKMSHSGPEFSESTCMRHASQSFMPIVTEVLEVSNETKKKRGYSTSYCISVADNHNFFTSYGVVANCRDTTGTWEAAREQRADLVSRGLQNSYNDYLMRLVDPVLEMSSRGIPFSFTAREELKEKTAGKIQELTKRLETEVARPINHRSSKQKLAYLTENNVKIPKKWNKTKGESRETTDAASLRKILLKRPDLTALKTMIEVSSLSTAMSSFIGFDTKPGEQILRYSLGKLTETMRFAGGSDPWDRGINPHTIPREGSFDVSIKSMFVAPEGWSFLEADLKQAESKFVAYDSADKTLIDMLESGEDVHRHVGAEIFGVSPSEVSKDQRQLGKKSGHGANYDMGVNRFIETCFEELDLILPKPQAVKTLEAYHKLFPGIRLWHEGIRKELKYKRKLSTPWGWERYFYGRPGDDMAREAYAFRPQSTIPWITNQQILGACRERAKGNLNFKLLLQVHDSGLYLAKDKDIPDLASYCLRYREWQPGFDLPGGRLFLESEVKVGKSLNMMKEWQQ